MTTPVGTNLRSRANVDDKSQNYRDMQQKWHLIDSLLGGTRSMRAARQTYLPQDVNETDAAYNARVARSFLFNAFAKTVNSMTGKVFSKPIILKEDVPQQLVDMWEDIDREGRKGDMLCEEIFRHSMSYGVCHALIDMPLLPPGATLKDEQEMNHRPYWVKVTPQQLWGYRSVKIGSRRVLTQVRIYEEEVAEDGDYGEIHVQQIREISLTEWKLWRYQQKSPRSKQYEWQLVARGVNTLGMVPLISFYTKRDGFMLASPPLEDLAWMNVAHWQSSSDQRHILHVARVPILFGSGLGENADQITVGPNRLINGPENSSLQYVEHSGSAISSGKDDIATIEGQMVTMGMELLLPAMRGGGQTATAASLDYADVNSPLQFMAQGLGDFIEQGLRISALWLKLGEDAGGSVKVNTDFGITLRDAADVQALVQARIAGEISAETFWAELKRRNILSDDFDPTTEAKLLAKEQEAALDMAKATAEATAPPAGAPGVGSDVTGAPGNA